MTDVRPLGAARAHLADGRFAEAERAAREEIRLDPYSIAAYVVLADAASGQGRWGTARAAAQRAIALAPDRPDGHIAFASALIGEGRAAEAEAAARRAVAHGPASPTAHMVLGYALESQDKHAEANREFDVAITLEPPDDDRERLWKRTRAPVVVAVSIAGFLAIHTLQELARRFTFQTVAMLLVVATAVLIIAVLTGLALQRSKLARLTPTERFQLAVEARRQRGRDANYLGHIAAIAIVISGLSIVTLLYAVGQKPTLNVAVGDCFSSDRMYMVDGIATIPCQVPHDFEVFAVLSDPAPAGEPYPGIDQLHARTRPQCERLYQNYVGVPFSSDAPTDINTFAVEESYWRLDLRTMFCTLRDWNARQLVGSKKHG
jgi:tetratricopeptide (TPR) repeat protein